MVGLGEEFGVLAELRYGLGFGGRSGINMGRAGGRSLRDGWDGSGGGEC